nr:LysR substrate-binding domain-containing protein [uncultured Caldimonas sp.]
MSTPLAQLASLDLIRGFVAVGRRMSITLAAHDLCLTQSAVSRQIHALEERLGVKLLVRGHRSLMFTPEGERLFRSADGAVQQLQDVMGTLTPRDERRPITLSASIGVTGLWLLPRLGRFQQLHPDVDVRVAASNRVVDMQAEGVDLAIRYTRQAAVPDGAIRLFGQWRAPVAHPSLGLRSIDTPDVLSQQVLLELDDPPPQRPWLHWDDWIAARGWGKVRPRGVLRFNQYDQIIHAAIAGQGIALGRLELLDPMIADGRLVVLAPSERSGERGHAYWLLTPPQPWSAGVSALVQWIEAEARRPGVASADRRGAP